MWTGKRGERERLETNETAESLLALVEESADEQDFLTATRLKIQTAKRHFPPPPPPLRQTKPSKLTDYEV